MKNSNRETIEAARAAIRENPDKATQAAANEALTGWFVGKVMKRLDGRGDRDTVECVVSCELTAFAATRRLRIALIEAGKHIEWSSKIALAYLAHDNPVNMAEGKSQQWLSLHDHSTTFSKTVLDEIKAALALASTEPNAQPENAPKNTLNDGVAARLDALRADGWTVAVHNDYRLGGVAHTFWLFTKGYYAVKGEGLTDAEALDQCRAGIDDLQEGRS